MDSAALALSQRTRLQRSERTAGRAFRTLRSRGPGLVQEEALVRAEEEVEPEGRTALRCRGAVSRDDIHGCRSVAPGSQLGYGGDIGNDCR